MPFQTHELEAIKQAAANAIVEWGGAAGVHVQHLQVIASAALEAIDKAAEDPTDPRPFSPGTRVLVKASTIEGAVVRTVEDSGEVHTVVLRLDGIPGEHPFGPRELEVLA